MAVAGKPKLFVKVETYQFKRHENWVEIMINANQKTNNINLYSLNRLDSVSFHYNSVDLDSKFLSNLL